MDFFEIQEAAKRRTRWLIAYFAAGHSIGDAAIGVTGGCLNALSRDELQGVIAHEFSHILNGDMRLNTRLIGLVHGILAIAIGGRILARVGREAEGRVGLVFLAGGAFLFVVGYLGVFFGRLIKSVVARQREFLADAAAVQFGQSRLLIGRGTRTRDFSWFCLNSPRGQIIKMSRRRRQSIK